MKTLPRRLPFLVLIVAFTLWAGLALAHKVNVFAVAEGGVVSGEGYFSGGAKAQSVPVEILDATGAVVAQGMTERDGTFKILLPPQASPPLKVVLKAGDGHQNDFTLTAQDLAQAVPAAQGAGAPVAAQASSSPGPAAAPAATASGSPAAAPLDEARLAALVEAAVAKELDEKLAPLKLQLARKAEEDQSARLRDIIGGLGWIIGLVGIAAWFKRPKN